MHFNRNQNMFSIFLLWGIASFMLGVETQVAFNLPMHTVVLINVGIFVLFCIVHGLRIRLTPLRWIEHKIHKLPHTHQKLKMFFDEYIPETRKTYPQTIYKYVYLDDISQSEKDKFNLFSTELEFERWLVNSSNHTGNENKLFSLATNALWFSRSNSPTLNDPFEGRRIVYNSDILPFNKSQIEYLKQYAEDIRNHLFICCFSQNIVSPPMWAHYTNNYKGFCLKFEIANPHNLWEVSYGYGKNLPNFEIDGLQEDLWEDRITRDEAYQYLEQLHIYWASSKHGDWQYENEIRALFTNLNKDMNVAYETIGIKLSRIIIGHNCAKEHRQFLRYIANKLSIPVSITSLNTTSINYLDIVDYEE